MASKPTVRGNSTRTTWLLGGNGPKQSFTVSNGKPEDRLKVVLAAKALAESRNHDLTRDEAYRILFPAKLEVSSAPTFKMWVEAWLTSLADRDACEPHVLYNYRRVLERHWLKPFGNRRLTDITRADITDWVSKVKKKHATVPNTGRSTGQPLSPFTIHHYFMIGSACLAAAMPRWIEENPARYPRKRDNDIGLPKLPQSPGMFLTPSELDLILSQCPPDLYDIVYVASRSGLRIGELLALESRHILFARDGSVTILVRLNRKPDGTTGSLKTEGSFRDVPVDGEAARILARRTKGRPPSARVFLTARGKPWIDSGLRNRHWAGALGAARRCAEHPPPPPVQKKTGPRRQWGPKDVSVCECPARLHRVPRFHDLRHTHA